jgi:hypothetical protein
MARVPAALCMVNSMDLEKIINHIFTYSFPTDEELVLFANERRGFGGDDGGYGVIYPSDLDEYATAVELRAIPDGSVEIYCLAYTDKDIIISEHQYLLALKKYLVENNRRHLACEIKNA